MRCIFRIFRIETIDLYKKGAHHTELLDKISSQLNLSKSLTENYDSKNVIYSENPSHENCQYCATCLGILQKADNHDHVADVAKRVVNEGFEFKSFKFTIRIPLATGIRLAQMMYFVQKEIQNEEKYKEEQEQQEIKKFFDLKENATIDIKTAVKWVLAPNLATHLNVAPIADDRFIINLQYKNPELDVTEFAPYEKLISQAHIDQWQERIQKKLKHNLPQPELRKVNFTEPSNSNQERILNLPSYAFMSLHSDEKGNYLPPKTVTQELQFDLDCSHAAVFVMGNYLKFSRLLSQSPWEVDGKKLYETSIQEEIAKIVMPYYQPKDYKFHTGGREDIDVRMLGNGRPFVLEILDPKKSYSVSEDKLKEMEAIINTNPMVNAIGLHYTNEKCFEVLKESETSKVKAYACMVVSEKEITQQDVDNLNNMRDIKLQQKTPLRVLHRRTLMIREKVIHKLKAVYVNEHYMVLFVMSSAGTYIKEFVHGDLERTKPNVGSILGGEVDILQLDVMKLYTKFDEESEADFLKICEVYEPGL